VDHDICAVLRTPTLLLGLLAAVGSACLAFIHLHVVVALVFLLVILTFRVLNVNVFAASIRLGVVVDCRTSCVFAAVHGSVFATNGSTLDLFVVLVVLLLNAVLVAVCNKVGLGLLGGELCGSRLLGVPGAVSQAWGTLLQ
jgi:hypothetical protein